ncbi:WD40-repeat-containing domain protein [Vararia minispora EC-137]|uniref:WD40-repeat-containing domain protein n=1 Tax=Vararia minispora EC-137 TaxID=1314806 RepID=A0ACB8Q574_9AGAM|nr:WD40-repeat-containing domain protein [Vararia minispora EC-137]
MATGKPGYTLVESLEDAHIDSINCLAFNPNGSYFASGANDGTVCVFSTDKTSELRRYQSDFAIDAIVWDGRYERTLLVGDRSGDVHTIRIGSSEVDDRIWREHISGGSIYAMAARGLLLAISCGNNVHLVRAGAPSSWTSQSVLIAPPTFPELVEPLSPPVASCLQFMSDEMLLVTYVEHGIVAYSPAHLDIIWQIRPRTCRIGASHAFGDKIVASNLYDGLDWYLIQQTMFGAPTRLTHTTSITLDLQENVILPVKYIHGGAAVLVGGTNGAARIFNTTDGSRHQLLSHNDGRPQILTISPSLHF